MARIRVPYSGRKKPKFLPVPRFFAGAGIKTGKNLPVRIGMSMEGFMTSEMRASLHFSRFVNGSSLRLAGRHWRGRSR